MADFTVPARMPPASVIPIWRAVDGIGKLLVCGDGKEDVRGLHRNLEFMKIIILENSRMFERRFHQRLRTGLGIFLQKVAFQRTGVHPDTHRAPVIARRLDHLAHSFLVADIARVDPQACRSAAAASMARR